MILLLWIGREVARARQRERERLWASDADAFSRFLCWCFALVLAVLAITISPWIFWIGLFVVAPVVIALAQKD